MSFTNIFTSFLYDKKLNLNIDKIKNHIIQTHKKDKVGFTISNYGGWRSKTFVKTNPTVVPLFKELNEMVNKIKKQLKYKYNLKLINYWYNINSLGSSNSPHTHIGVGALLSGVFYVNTVKDGGRIVFMNSDNSNPVLYDNKIETYNEYNSSTWFVKPENNLAVIFPANLLHYVQPNLNKKEKRVSISFNYGL